MSDSYKKSTRRMSAFYEYVKSDERVEKPIVLLKMATTSQD